MIELLNDIRETILFEDIQGVKFYHNNEPECYPVHWHLEIEVIMPLKNHYTVTIGGEKVIIEEGDVFLLPPGELHELTAPPYGERIIMQVDYSIISNLKGIDSLIQRLHPYKLIRYEEEPVLAKNLFHLLKEIEKEYVGGDAFKEAIIVSHIIRFCVELGQIGRAHV